MTIRIDADEFDALSVDEKAKLISDLVMTGVSSEWTLLFFKILENVKNNIQAVNKAVDYVNTERSKAEAKEMELDLVAIHQALSILLEPLQSSYIKSKPAGTDMFNAEFRYWSSLSEK